jgi:hypothetical protein
LGSNSSIRESISTVSKPVKPSRAITGKKLELFGQDDLIPAAVEGELIVGDREPTALSFTEAADGDRRHFRQAGLQRRCEAAVASNDATCLVDQDRIVEAAVGDGGGDLGDLLLRMGAGVSRIRPQFADRPISDFKTRRARTGVGAGLPRSSSFSELRLEGGERGVRNQSLTPTRLRIRGSARHFRAGHVAHRSFASERGDAYLHKRG